MQNFYENAKKIILFLVINIMFTYLKTQHNLEVREN